MEPPYPPKDFPLFPCCTADPKETCENLKAAGFLSQEGLNAEAEVIELITRTIRQYEVMTSGEPDEYWSKLEMVANALIMSPYVTPDAFKRRPPVSEKVPIYPYCTLDPRQTYKQLKSAGMLSKTGIKNKRDILKYQKDALKVFKKTSPDAREEQLREMLARALMMSDYIQK